jgi:hypothetical protein
MLLLANKMLVQGLKLESIHSSLSHELHKSNREHEGAKKGTFDPGPARKAEHTRNKMLLSC